MKKMNENSQNTPINLYYFKAFRINEYYFDFSITINHEGYVYSLKPLEGFSENLIQIQELKELLIYIELFDFTWFLVCLGIWKGGYGDLY